MTAGEMRYREYEPHSILQDSVKCFWVHDSEDSPATEQDIVPDGCVELIFNFGSPYLLRTATGLSPLPGAFIVGFQDQTMSIVIRGRVRVVAARLFAWGALALLQDNVTTLTNTTTALGPQWNALVRGLKILVARGSYEEAVKSLEDFLVNQELVRKYDLKLIRTAAKLLDQSKGQYRISELADYCALSVRQLERGFQRVLGTSPKNYARTVRFHEAQRKLMFAPDTELTGLAYDCGYFDQAHFIKDFKKFTGKTPSEYAEQMRKFQEILKDKGVVFLQSNAEPDG